MVNSKNLTIVTISTILFGLLSKWLVGVPYMAWGYFDKLFIKIPPRHIRRGGILINYL